MTIPHAAQAAAAGQRNKLMPPQKKMPALIEVEVCTEGQSPRVVVVWRCYSRENLSRLSVPLSA